jgi:hypothetical protein
LLRCPVGHGLFQVIAQERAVGQMGKRIKEGQLLYSLLGALAFGDVVLHADVIGHGAVTVL